MTVLDYTYYLIRPLLPAEVTEYFRILKTQGEHAADLYRRKCCGTTSIPESKLELRWPRGSRP